MTIKSLMRAYKKASQEGVITVFKETLNELQYILNKKVLKYIGIDKSNIITLKCDGVTVDVSASPITDEILYSLLLESYEQEEAKFVREHISSDPNLIELGAGIGYLSCYCDKHINPRTHIAVEPNPHLQHVIKENKRLNNGTFELIEAAYSYGLEPVTLSITESFLSSRTSKNDGEVKTRSVNLRTLVDQFDLSTFCLTVDIEGSELDILANEMALLENHCKVIIIEFHDQKKEFADIWQRTVEMRKKLKQSTFTRKDQVNAVAVFKNTKFS